MITPLLCIGLLTGLLTPIGPYRGEVLYRGECKILLKNDLPFKRAKRIFPFFGRNTERGNLYGGFVF